MDSYHQHAPTPPFVSYLNSTPSSTHSSPQSYTRDLDVYHNPYPQSNPYPHHLPAKSATYGPSLHVSTATNNQPHEQDPNERTARPGNAYRHAQFHAQTMPLPSQIDQQSISSHSRNSSQDITNTFSSSTSGLSSGLSRPLKPVEQDRLAQLDRLKFFLATAPSRWDSDAENTATNSTYNGLPMHQGGPDAQGAQNPLHRFLLPSGEYVSCVLWNGLYHITGTDIVRALVFRFESFGRPVRNMKKFEEGVFSDLRNLKPGVDACLEEPKSPFLDLLFKYQCIRTQKKQKVFYWFSVPHDRLFLDALERDLKREKMGQEPTTVIIGEPALSFTYDPKKSLYEQFSKAQGVREGEGELESAVRMLEEGSRMQGDEHNADISATDESDASASDADEVMADGERNPALQTIGLGSSWLGGSSSYKVRKKGPKRDEEKRGRSTLSETRRRYASLSLSQERGGDYPGGGDSSSSMSAADMFYMQARGELSTVDSMRRPRQSAGDMYYSDGPQTQASRFLDNQRTRSQEPLHRHTYPLAPPPATTSSALSANGFHTSFAQQQQDATTDATGKTKAFVCPLFSCGRMFKRMEHLKRHLRTHTMERPYSCPQCNKKFSRSDNLNQHLRTHGRGPNGSAGTGTALGLGVGEWIDNGGDDADGSGSGSSPDARNGGSSGREVESTGSVESDYDEMDNGNPVLSGMFGSGGMGMGMGYFNSSVLGGAAAASGGANLVGYGSDIDPRSCEVEVQGDVHDVSGDEDGLIRMSYVPEGFQDSGVGLTPNGHGGGDYGSGWGMRPQPSPAFSQTSAPSPPPALRSNRNSLSSIPPNSVAYDDDYGSLSAPSHKQHFDHSSLYSQGMLDAANAGPGPIRRYRSMTPSSLREPRRPGTAGSTSDFSNGSPVPSAAIPMGGRGYHPYVPYTSSSRAGSTHSSPSTYPMSLSAAEYSTAAAHPGMRRSDSRNSNLGEQMMNMSMDGGGGGGAGAGVGGVGGGVSVPRTESPGTFVHELPQQYGNAGHGVAGEYAMEGTLHDPLQDQGQYVMQGVNESTYYSHPHTHPHPHPQHQHQHVTL